MNRSFLICVLIAASINGFTLDYWTEREFFEKSCLSCHAMNDYLWPRSYKAWELTIANMRVYIGDETLLDEEGGKRIAEFLTMYTGEGELFIPIGDERQSSDEKPVESVSDTADDTVTTSESPLIEKDEIVSEIPASNPQEVNAPVVSVEPAPIDSVTDVKIVEVSNTDKTVSVPVTPKLQMPLLKRIWNPGRTALKGARLTGFFGVASLLGLLLSGFGRRKLRTNFRVVHRLMAFGLLATLAVHAVIYIFEYGTPHVLWYWFGFIGSVLLVLTLLQGKLRRRLKLGPLSLHISMACFALALSILHWIWAWL